MEKGVLQNSKNLEKRRLLRKNQTEAEAKLWANLRGKRLQGIKFVRQYSIGNFILDFYCPKYQLGIELDGGQHNEEKVIEYDDKRTKYIESKGVKILRFWNTAVFKNMDGVCGEILREISNRNPKF